MNAVADQPLPGRQAPTFEPWAGTTAPAQQGWRHDRTEAHMQRNTTAGRPAASARLDTTVRSRIGILTDRDLLDLADIVGNAVKSGHGLEQLHAGIRAERNRRRGVYLRTGLGTAALGIA
ncbi:hypothetical protein [Actinocatenispora rupis]|uniref:Uncharacterized protein n=1 Tax=Actinocatenispora rupis TaxID=519421 RepID=A0A8J3JC78_9ACTN|nr:hypothetical protein [Actinocatenispora rupis]GID14079.1 hypothetical protein Aru02nite_49680 [Actinocatenispora rupis]